MPRKMVVIGDEDAVFGLGLLGLEGRTVASVEQARQAIKEASADPETSLILLTENWAEAEPEFVSESAPLIVQIPGAAAGKRSTALEQRIERALGVHLSY